MSKKILVALSGGVDSSVAAWLLKQEKWQVQGVHFIFSKKTQVADCRKLANFLKIPLHLVDARKDFKKQVIDRTLREYQKGLTPNPCVICNEIVKFKLLIRLARRLGITQVATGHYARKTLLKKEWFIKTAKDLKKDQSYFLSRLNSTTIAVAEFPLGEYTKEQVKAIAFKNSLPTAVKTESQGLCFVTTKKFRDFLKKKIKSKAGEILNPKKEAIGKHRGLSFYTLGQREGIGLSGGPYFVIGKNQSKNQLIVSNLGDDPNLYQIKMRIALSSEEQRIRAEKLLTLFKKAKPNFWIKTRYGNLREQPAKLLIDQKKNLRVELEKPIRAVTPGQVAVFYDQTGRVWFSGVILKK